MTDTTKYIVQGIALILVFGAKVVEKWRSKGSDLKQAQAERLYWIILTLGLVIALITEFYEANDKHVTEIIRKVDEATHELNNAFDQVKGNPSLYPALQRRVYVLEAARKELLPYGERTDVVGPFIRATQDLGLGQERVAYGYSKMGCRYYLNGGLHSCKISKGSEMGSDVQAMHWPGVIRCTNIENKLEWTKATDTLHALDVLVERTSLNTNSGQEIQSKVARNVGYFYLCDYLRNGRVDSLQSARRAWDFFESKTDKTTMQTIYPDMPNKILVLHAIETLADPSHPSLLCSETCPSGMD
jgi:hypothetical protein